MGGEGSLLKRGGERRQLFESLTLWARERRPFVVATVTSTGGSTPRYVGATMAFRLNEQVGTVGGGAFEHHLQQEAMRLINAYSESGRQAPRQKVVDVHLVHELGMCCGGKMSALLNRYDPAPSLWLCGAGHINQAIAQHASLLGWQITILDERAEWIHSDRLPAEVRRIDDDLEASLLRDPPKEDDFVLIATHDHQLDERIVECLLLHPPVYLGLIGSRGKWGRFRRRLSARGIPAEMLDRVSCPAGLPIGGEEPHEIALSVLAELVQLCHAPQPATSPLSTPVIKN